MHFIHPSKMPIDAVLPPPVPTDHYWSRLEHRPKPQLYHEFGVGSRCNRCDCPGLDLHYWRKICKVCGCRLDQHDVQRPEGQEHGLIVAGKLFGRPPMGEHGSNRRISIMEPAAGREGREESTAGMGGIRLVERIPVDFCHQQRRRQRQSSQSQSPPPSAADPVIYENVVNCRHRSSPMSSAAAPLGAQKEDGGGGDWAWTPAGEWALVSRYLLALDEQDRPLRGTQGEQLRRQRLAQQLPYHDSDVHAGQANKGDKEQQQHAEFIELVKQQAVGIAEVVDYAQHKAAHCQSAGRLTTASEQRGGGGVAAAAGGRLPLNCRQCRGQFDEGSGVDVGVATDHERDCPEAIWHPRCFVCSVCHQLLVDLLYFFREGKYFCGRHYGEQLYPRCAGCDELIFSREYTFAEERSWHLEHFCCFGCDRHLSGQRYVVKEAEPFCVDCYMHKFATVCVSCCNKIAPFDHRISYAQLHWHASTECFKCKCCAKPLSNQRFLLYGDHPFCSSECKMRFLDMQ